jgi:hypothetical protein
VRLELRRDGRERQGSGKLTERSRPVAHASR